MKKFHKIAAQGEITILRIGPVREKPAGLAGSILALENGKYIVGHSETGHHHVLDHADGVTITVLDTAPAGMKILHAILANPNALVHMREHDTHETIALEPGEYEIRIAREFDHYAELARQSQD